MPKIISNSIISSSDNRDDPQGLHSYYCLCSEFILVIGKCFAHSYIDIKAIQPFSSPVDIIFGVSRDQA